MSSRAMLKEVLDPLARWSSSGEAAGLATLVNVRRSAPRPPGARFAISAAGETAGSISSGCIEGDLYEHLQGVMSRGEPRLLSYGISDEMAAEVGLSCGGEIQVLAEPYDAADPVWTELADIAGAEEPAVLITGLSGAAAGRHLVAREGRDPVGSLGGAELDEIALAAGARVLSTGAAKVITLDVPRESTSVFAEALLPPARMVIVGASPIGAALCHLASFVGFQVFVVDPRETFLAEDKFPQAKRLLLAWPDEALAELSLDPYVAVVVLAHDGKLDVPALAAALRAGCRYVGQIGGRRTQRLRREALAGLGFDQAQLDRIHGPVGLDIGSKTPEEIALAIIAEVLATQRGRAPLPSSRGGDAR